MKFIGRDMKHATETKEQWKQRMLENFKFAAKRLEHDDNGVFVPDKIIHDILFPKVRFSEN